MGLHRLASILSTAYKISLSKIDKQVIDLDYIKLKKICDNKTLEGCIVH